MAIEQVAYQWFSVGTIGTTQLTANPASFVGAYIPGTYVGSVILHDAGSSTGTTGTSSFGTIGIPATSIPGFISIPARCKNGILIQATGTPTMTLFWDGL